MTFSGTFTYFPRVLLRSVKTNVNSQFISHKVNFISRQHWANANKYNTITLNGYIKIFTKYMYTCMYMWCGGKIIRQELLAFLLLTERQPTFNLRILAASRSSGWEQISRTLKDLPVERLYLEAPQGQEIVLVLVLTKVLFTSLVKISHSRKFPWTNVLKCSI